MRIRCLILSLLICCVSCNRDRPSDRWMMEDTGKLKILTTTAMIGDLVEQIGKDKVEVAVLIQGDVDPHSYEMRKGDAEKFDRADIIFYNGLGLEHGASLAARLLDNPKAFAVTEGMTSLVYLDHIVDPHVWMDLRLWAETAVVVQEVLSSMRPEEASFFREGTKAFVEGCLTQDAKIYAKMQAIPANKRYLVTSHDAFQYYGRRYLATDEERVLGTWQERVVAPEGLAPEGQVSLIDIQNMVKHLKIYDIDVVFPESNLSATSLKKIVDACRKQGIEIKIAKEPLYGDVLGSKGEGADTVIKMVDHNAEVMQTAWTSL